MLAHCVQSPEAASTKPALGLSILPLPLGVSAMSLCVLGIWLIRRRKAGYPEKLRDHHRTHAPVAGHHNALVVTDIEVRASSLTRSWSDTFLLAYGLRVCGQDVHNYSIPVMNCICINQPIARPGYRYPSS